MRKIINLNSGVYLLEIKAEKKFKINIKKFSCIVFPTGYYYYAGSAQKNLSHRISRHLKKDKIIHWHIDNITAVGTNHIKSIFLLQNSMKDIECQFVSKLISCLNLKFIAEGFGNSDCNSCKSHLLFSRKRIDQNHFISLYQSIVRFIPSSRVTV